MSRLVILQDERPDWVKVFCPFSREWLEGFKEAVPGNQREAVFEKTGNQSKFVCWRVHKVSLAEVEELMERFFPGQPIESDLVGTEITPAALPSGDWLQAAFATVPLHKSRHLYRALAMIFHPDTGGSEEMMKKLNEVYETKVKEGR